MNKYSDRCSDKGPSPEIVEPFEDKMHQLSLLKRDALFDPKAGYKFSDKLGDVEQDPFIGFVGKNYFESKLRVCFLGKANAETKNPQYDLRINKSLLAFRSAQEKSRSNLYSKYCELYKDIIPTWNIYRYPKQFLESLGWRLNDITYANVVPFRYKGDPTKKVYETSFQYFTGTFLEAISPDIIIPLGEYLHETIEKHSSVSATVLKGVERVQQDNRTLPRSEEYLNAIAEWVKQRLAENDHN